MPEDISDYHQDNAGSTTPSHEPISSASGTPVSGRLVALVTGIFVVIVVVAAVLAYSQGVFTHPASSY